MANGSGPGGPPRPGPAARGVAAGLGLDDWFVQVVLPLEPALVAFLRRGGRQAADIADLRQEVYARVYEAAARERPRFPRAFVFAIARNLLIDRLRQARIVQIDAMGDLSSLNVIGDEAPADLRLSARQELERFRRALEALPPRRREVVVLRKVDGLSQKEVAARMGVTQATVEKQLAKAMLALADALGASEPPSRDPGRRKRRWRLGS